MPHYKQPTRAELEARVSAAKKSLATRTDARGEAEPTADSTARTDAGEPIAALPNDPIARAKALAASAKNLHLKGR